MRWVICVILFIVIFIGSGSVSATGEYWSDPPVLASVVKSDGFQHFIFPCGGALTYVKVSLEVLPQRACVYGQEGGMRVARYVNGNGVDTLLVSPPFDSAFYVMSGVCQSWRACVYSQESDTLFAYQQVGVYGSELVKYPHFSKNIKREIGFSTVYFTYSALPEPAYETFTTPVRSLAVSRTGRWVVAEHPGVGFVRIDTRGGELRRIEILGQTDSKYRLAISDDGATVAMGSERNGTAIITVNTTCGDLFVDGMSSSFPSHVQYCERVSIDFSVDFNQVLFASHPIFQSATKLSFRVVTTGGEYDTVYSPAGLVEHGKYNYIAMGDSFTSGEGELSDAYYLPYTNQPPHSCHTSSRSYPYLLVQTPLLYATTALNVACSGATMTDVAYSSLDYGGQGERLRDYSEEDRVAMVRQAALNDWPGIVPQIYFAEKYQPRVLTLGVGGNDAGFMGKLKSCLGFDVCHWAKAGYTRQAIANEIDALESRLMTTVAAINGVSPQTVVSLVGYPQIINANKDARCDMVTGALLSYEERQFMTKSITRINQVIRRAADLAGIQYLSMEDAYDNHKLCDDSKTPAVNGVRLGDDIGPIASLPGLKVIGAESFHPTPFGHSLTSQSFVEQMGGQSVSFMAQRFAEGDDPYWSENSSSEQSDDYIQRYIALPSSDMSSGGTSGYGVVVPEGTFVPGSLVVVSFYEDGKMYNYKASDDGGVNEWVSLPDSGGEVSTLFVEGVTTTWERVAFYKIFFRGAEHQFLSNEHIATNSAERYEQRGASAIVKRNPISPGVSLASLPVVDIAKQGVAEQRTWKGSEGVDKEPSSAGIYLWVAIVMVLLSAASLSVILYKRYNKRHESS